MGNGAPIANASISAHGALFNILVSADLPSADQLTQLEDLSEHAMEFEGIYLKLSYECSMTLASSTENEIRQIIHHSQQANAVKNIGGHLVIVDPFSEQYIIRQTIEGNVYDIIVLWCKIKQDKRVEGIITSSYSFCEEKTYDRWGMELHPSYTSEFAKDFMKEHCKHMIMHHNHIKTVFIVEDMRTGKHYMLKEVLILQSLHKLPCTNEHDVLELVHADEEPGIAILGLSPKPDIFHELVKVSMVYPLYEMDLFNMIGYHTKKTKQEGLPMNVIVMYLAQMLEMLRRLRSKGVVHRDVKPENICVDGRGNLVLIDFEMAVQHDSNKFVDSSLVVGTIFYIAPESFKYREYSNLTDLWAVGVIACELYSAALPWDIRSGMSGPQILKILEETEPEKPTGMQDDLWQFLAKIFVDKNSRMTVEEAIRDPIFSKWCPGLNFARYGSKDEEMVTDLGNVFDQHDCLAEIRSLCEAKGLISQLQSKTTREKFNTLTKKNKSTNLRRDRILHQNSYFNDAIMYSLDSDSLRSESSGSNLKSGASQGTDGDSKE